MTPHNHSRMPDVNSNNPVISAGRPATEPQTFNPAPGSAPAPRPVVGDGDSLSSLSGVKLFQSKGVFDGINPDSENGQAWMTSEVVQAQHRVGVVAKSSQDALSPIGAPATLTAAALVGVGLMKWGGTLLTTSASAVAALVTLAGVVRWYRNGSAAKKAAGQLAEESIEVRDDLVDAGFCTGDPQADQGVERLITEASKLANSTRTLPPPVVVVGDDVDKALVAETIAVKLRERVPCVVVNCSKLAAKAPIDDYFISKLVSCISSNQTGSGPTKVVVFLDGLDRLEERDHHGASALVQAVTGPTSPLRDFSLLVTSASTRGQVKVCELLQEPLSVVVPEPTDPQHIACLLKRRIPSLNSEASGLFARVFGSLRSHNARQNIAEAVPVSRDAADTPDRVIEAIMNEGYGPKLKQDRPTGEIAPDQYELPVKLAVIEALVAKGLLDMGVVGVSVNARENARGKREVLREGVGSASETNSVDLVLKELVLGWVGFLVSSEHHTKSGTNMPAGSMQFSEKLGPALDDAATTYLIQEKGNPFIEADEIGAKRAAVEVLAYAAAKKILESLGSDVVVDFVTSLTSGGLASPAAIEALGRSFDSASRFTLMGRGVGARQAVRDLLNALKLSAGDGASTNRRVA